MNLHEYQAKRLFLDHAIPVPPGMVATNVTEAVTAAHELAGPIWVVKAQVHAGGRGKAGGVKLAKNAAEARELASVRLSIAFGVSMLLAPIALGALADEVGLGLAHLALPALIVIAYACFFIAEALQKRSGIAAPA